MPNIRSASTIDIPHIQQLAHTIWPKTYGSIISSEQLNYMLELFYNSSLLHTLIECNQQTFCIAEEGKEPVGFASFSIVNSENPTAYKLHKLYVSTKQQQKGVGKALLLEVMERVKKLGGTSLILNVNRQNSARDFYKKMGFDIIDEVDNEIGNGYYMNDYVMSIKIA
jgi:ribosomal protein S18 acetylase RimI-like enzyme